MSLIEKAIRRVGIESILVQFHTLENYLECVWQLSPARAEQMAQQLLD